jgi:hypothetical protein
VAVTAAESVTLAAAVAETGSVAAPVTAFGHRVVGGRVVGKAAPGKPGTGLAAAAARDDG